MPKSIPTAKLAFIFVVGLLFVVHSVSAADPTIVTNTNYYDISGTYKQEIFKEMSAKEIKGYWAYTPWKVRWSSSCEVKVTVSYTYPKLKDRNRSPLSLRNTWDKMMRNLIAHEEQHGINAANEIVENDCHDAWSITRRWAQQVKIFDAETEHGRLQGITLSV